MRKVPALRYPWNSLATVLLAVAFFMPAKELVAQMPAAGASSQAQEFTQNVKEVYFPFNVYNRIVDPSGLNSDADWLKQHPDAHFWIQGYADARGDIFYNLVLSYQRANLSSRLWFTGVLASRRLVMLPGGASSIHFARRMTRTVSRRIVAGTSCRPI